MKMSLAGLGSNRVSGYVDFFYGSWFFRGIGDRVHRIWIGLSFGSVVFHWMGFGWDLKTGTITVLIGYFAGLSFGSDRFFQASILAFHRIGYIY